MKLAEKFKPNKEKRSLKTRIVILIIISLLSNYFLILGEFTGVVLAATEEWNARPSIILPENNEINSTDGQSTESNGEINTEQTENESKTDESKPDQSETDESKPDQSETNESETDQLNTNQVETNETEEETETDNVSDENSESEKSSEEKLEASIGIINTYKFLNGLIVKAKISMETKNVKSNLDSEKIVFSTPQIDGFKLINTYLEDVKLNDETLTYTSSIVNNEVVVDIVTAYVEESSDEITGEANETESNEVVSNINTGLVSGIDNNNETTQEEITIKDTKKEYTILYVFEGEGEAQKINLNVGQSLNYNDNIKELNSALEAKIEIQEKLNNKYSVSAQNSSIYKGYLYANSLTSLNYETRYTSIEEIEIVDLNNLDNIIITEKADNIVLKNGTIKDISNYTSYSKTSVDVKLFDNIFGEEGYIEIYSNGRLLGRIDKNSKVKDDRYVFEYPEIVSNVEFSLNNMINKGKIDILSNKAIRGTAGFSREEVISFGKIETNTIVQEFSKESEIALKLLETNNKLEINLEDTESKMDLEISTDSFSTNVDNNVIFTVTLKTSGERYELFKNPVIEIELPSDIQNVTIDGINLLYRNGLSVDKYEVVTNEFGNKILKVSLLGTQEEYTPELPSNGTTINLFTTVKLNRLTTNKDGNIKFRYTNDIDSRISYEIEGKDCIETHVNFVSKYGLLRALDLNNTKTNEEQVSYDTEMAQVRIENGTNDQIIKYKGTIVNNFEKTLNNVQVVGRIPTQGNKDINGSDLGTTFDMALESQIVTSGSVVEIYYSEDPNAQKDDSSWTTDVSDLTKFKSFKLVFTSEEMKQGELLEFSFNMRVPDGIEFNEKAYATFTTYYKMDNQELQGICTNKLFTNVKEITMEDYQEVENQKVANLDIKTIVSQCGKELSEGDTIHEREIVDYTVYVKNTSDVEAKNIRVKATPNNANLYYIYYFESDEYDLETMEKYYYYVEDEDESKGFEEFAFETLKPGETIICEYKAMPKEISDIEDAQIYSDIEVSADGIETQTIETIKNQIVNAKISLKLEWAYRQMVEFKDVYGGSGLKYRLYVENLSNTIIENQEVSFVIPNSVEYNDYAISGAEDCRIKVIEGGETSTIIITIPSIKSKEIKEFFIPLRAKEVDISLLSTDVELYAYANIDNDQIKSNRYIQTIYQARTAVNYSFTVDKDSNVILKDGDLVTYTLTLKNIGKIDARFFRIKDVLPNGLKLESAKFIRNGKEEDKEIVVNYQLIFEDELLSSNEEIQLNIVARVSEKDLNYDQKTLENKLTISGGSYFDNFDTNVISLNVHNDKVTIDREDEDNNFEEDITPPTIQEEQLPDIDDGNDDNNIDNNDNKNDGNVNNNDNNTNNDVNDNSNDDVNNNVVNNQNNNNTNNNDNSQKGQSNNVEPKLTYRVSGKAWLDKNKNGIYENGEELLSNINTIVYKVNTNGIIETNTIIASTKTAEDGTYEIKGLEPAKYVVVFEYDTEMYSETKYQVTNAKTTENSDVISKILESTNKKVGMTDIIEISDSSLINIDIGLVLNNEFDLKLDKYVSRAIVYNSKGEKETKFERDNLVKIEINSKLFEKSTIDIFYNIVVTNEGDVSGYVSKIVDYLPKGLTFDVERNEDWYQSEDGVLYYTGLIDKQIMPGERKTISLVLTYESNSIQSRRILNSAELSEISNEKGLTDIDSIVNNKVETEDDYGQVEVLVTISTGTVVNILLIIVIIAIVCGAIIIPPKVYKKIAKRIYK